MGLEFFCTIIDNAENGTMNSKAKERLCFLLGILICFAVAGLAVLLENLIPGGLLGASIIALFTGTVINSFFHPKWIKPALKFTSKKY